MGAVAGNKVSLWRASDEDWESIGAVEDADEIAQFDFHPAHEILAMATSAQSVWSWDIDTKREVGEALRYDDWVRSVSFSGDGSRFAAGTGAHERTVWLYTGEPGDYEKKRGCAA